jgi:hypothetical protein
VVFANSVYKMLAASKHQAEAEFWHLPDWSARYVFILRSATEIPQLRQVVEPRLGDEARA